MRFILVLRSTFELLQEPMRFILVLRITFELQQEPMRFILVLRITFELHTFELQQEPMRFNLVLRSTFELQQEPMRFILVLRSTFELLQEPMRFILVLRSTFELLHALFQNLVCCLRRKHFKGSKGVKAVPKVQQYFPASLYLRRIYLCLNCENKQIVLQKPCGETLNHSLCGTDKPAERTSGPTIPQHRSVDRREELQTKF
ncbi:hypothetical protein PO909_020201 [Leuciscus waleckii]